MNKDPSMATYDPSGGGDLGLGGFLTEEKLCHHENFNNRNKQPYKFKKGFSVAWRGGCYG